MKFETFRIQIPEELLRRITLHFDAHPEPGVAFTVAVLIREYLDDCDREEQDRNEAPPAGTSE